MAFSAYHIIWVRLVLIIIIWALFEALSIQEEKLGFADLTVTLTIIMSTILCKCLLPLADLL